MIALLALSACAHSEAPASSATDHADKAEKKAGGSAKPADLAPAEQDTARKPPAPGTDAPTPTSPTTGTGTMPATTAAQPAPTPPEPPPEAQRRVAAVNAARRELAAAQRELDLAANDCPSACRALASMERATGHLCDLAPRGADDERAQCEDAKNAVQKARAKIKGACGTCPGGPSLERTAPIPSRP